VRAPDYTLRWLNVRSAWSCQPFRLSERMRFPSTSWVSLHECKPDRAWDLRACYPRTDRARRRERARVCWRPFIVSNSLQSFS
jgi:hypothetical protein